MSIARATTAAVTRNVRKLNKVDLAATPTPPIPAPPAAPDAAASQPTVRDMLVSFIPTEIVAPYTAVVAGLVGLIDEPTAEKPSPDQLVEWRWLVFGVMILTTIAVTVRSYRKKAQANARFPLLELTALTVTAAAWGLAMPESPLVPALDGDARAAAPLVIAFVAVAINTALGVQGRRQA